MNLQALYDLKERLEHAAIAGTGLLHEDFRLRRAVEALAPLAKANPVFAKISAGAISLLNASENERSTKLLDVLSLVDAVVYTQGVTNMPGSLTDLETGSGSYVQVSYGQLQPLLAALSGTGSGRTSLIREYWADHPEYFSDFRVLPHVVAALGDNYGELTDLIGEILMKQGSTVIPLLKENFDPAGKTEMARRVRLIAKLAGENENAWYVSILTDSKKDIREAVIQSLRLSKDNNQLLLDLCQSERGKLKEAAMRSLAAMDTEEAAAFWKKEIQKKPNLVACLKGVGSVLAADLAADSMGNFLEKLLTEGQVYDQSDLEQLTMQTSVLCGKYSDEVDSLWRWISERMDAFAQIVPEKNVRSCDLSVAEHLQKTLMITILWNDMPILRNMVKELSQSNRKWFLGCAMLADMAEMTSAELYAWYAPYIVRTSLLKRESAEQRSDRIQIMQALCAVRWSPELHAFTVVFPRFDALTGNPVTSARKLDGVDARWIDLLTDPKVNQDGAIYNLALANNNCHTESILDSLIPWLTDQGSQDVCRQAGEWLYRRLLDTGNMNHLFYPLLNCSWANWKGVLAHCFRKRGELSYNMTISLLRLMPMTGPEKAAELRELNELAKSGKLKIQYNFWPQDSVLRDIAILESDPNAEI